ncbi:hypothetical protein Y032_0718g1803 [Ancylostoma ceylanicum]|uniref:WAP domain-containing protein n=1 Tax=Ancylostoma ceylanicum TaxID=53326 RepID=A0A016WFK1_9BILA|nr:hypothetical protein Y032_0718g1803 [Ancylostoma ceylanicum]
MKPAVLFILLVLCGETFSDIVLLTPACFAIDKLVPVFSTVNAAGCREGGKGCPYPKTCYRNVCVGRTSTL